MPSFLCICPRSPQKAQIPPEVVSLPDNWILPSPSMICTHLVRQLRQVMPATNYQAAAAAPSCEGSLVPTTPLHHLVPFLLCPQAIPKPPPPSTAHIHLNSSLFYITPRNSRLPRPCNHTVDSMCRSKRVFHPGGNFDTTRVCAHTTSTTIHAPPSGSASLNLQAPIPTTHALSRVCAAEGFLSPDSTNADSTYADVYLPHS